MYKSKSTGCYEHDFRFADLPRYHLSYGVGKKSDAERLHATAVALFRARKTTGAVIDAMRAEKVNIEQLTQLREAGRPFTDALVAVVVEERWPVILHAITHYLAGVEQNPNRTAGTHEAAFYELERFKLFLEETGRSALLLDEITSSIVEEFQTWLLKKEFAQNTVSATVSRVGSIYHWFRRREDRLARESRRAPRGLHVPLDPETISREKTARVRYLSEDEAQRVLAGTPRPLLFPVAAALFGGFRIDELCHFRTQFDVDLDVGVLSVQKQPNWKPKTKRSNRHVPIADVLRPIVEYHLEHYASDEWMTPAARNPNRPINRREIGRFFARIVSDADLISGQDHEEGVTYHTLRHTFASWGLMSGTDVFTVSKLMGNTVQQIELTYGHLALDFRKAAVDRLAVAVTMPNFGDADSDGEAIEGQKNATTNATMEPAEHAIS